MPIPLTNVWYEVDENTYVKFIKGMAKYYRLDDTHICYNYDHNRWYLESEVKNINLSNIDEACGTILKQLNILEKNNFPKKGLFTKRATPDHPDIGKWEDLLISEQ
jgi:hypothetical protein